MIQLHKELLKTYKKCDKHILHEYSKFFYQKKVKDEKWVKYFIDCVVYEWQNPCYNDKKIDDYDVFEFRSQFTKNDRAINISTVSWTNDPLEKWRKYPTIEEIEKEFENLWKAYWSKYYQLYVTNTPTWE